MAFPVRPDPRTTEPESLFRVQDPVWLRRSITPVFVSHLSDGRFVGCGTSFFITPFGKQLSAMHVVTDFFNERRVQVRPNERGTFQYSDARIEILFDPGLFWGMRPAGTILTAAAFVMFPFDQASHPLAATWSLEELNRCEPALDLVSWDLANFENRNSEFLPLRIGQGPYVKPGDRVMAVGFSKNEGGRRDGRLVTTYAEEMFASVGTITDVDPEWDSTKKRWPRIVVDAYWPPGMSGGPVFNEAGEVIGLVSRGGENWSQALWLQKLPYNPDIYGCIDPKRPGWSKAWCACNAVSAIKLFHNREEAEKFVAGEGRSLKVVFCSTPIGGQIARPPRTWT